MEIVFAKLFEALGHPQRLDVFRLLARRYPQYVPAGEIANALGFKANTLSTYVSALVNAGLIERERQGVSVRYRIALSTSKSMLEFVSMDCLRGRADILEDVAQPRKFVKKANVLFLCTANSARSIFAECILRDIAGDRFNVYSAGSHPSGTVNPQALELLNNRIPDVGTLRSKDIREFQSGSAPVMDFVITVCDRAANEECPAWEGHPISSHWSVADPVLAEGVDGDVSQGYIQAYIQAYDTLNNKILALSRLPISDLPKAELQRRLDQISERSEEK